jgi:TfoX/Sxy family transcriptional regulator of competence genes
MSTKQETIDFILEQLSDIENIRARKMFGEYVLYCDEKVVGLVCDDELFIKPTEMGKEYVGADYEEGQPYPGAKIYIKIGEKIDDREWLGKLVRITADVLPIPKQKK